MGGGFAAPPITLASNQRPVALDQVEIPIPATDMHEKLLEKEGKTERTNLLGRSKDKPPKDKPPKQSKFAERLRRSFRRGDHRSLEIKRIAFVLLDTSKDLFKREIRIYLLFIFLR